MPSVSDEAKDLIFAVILVVCMTGTWQIQNWRYGEQLADKDAAAALDKKDVTDAANNQLVIEQARGEALAKQLAQQDEQHTQELQHVQANSIQLGADLRNARQRLSVRTTGNAVCRNEVPASASTTSLGDGSQRAELYPEDAANLSALTGDADQCAVKLTAMQDYARALLSSASGK